jgi:hypothetical protein
LVTSNYTKSLTQSVSGIPFLTILPVLVTGQLAAADAPHFLSVSIVPFSASHDTIHNHHKAGIKKALRMRAYDFMLVGRPIPAPDFSGTSNNIRPGCGAVKA